MRTFLLLISLPCLILLGCGEKSDGEKASGSFEGAEVDGEDEEVASFENLEAVENPETPDFDKEDSDELREEKYGNGQNKAQGHVRRDESDNYVQVGPWKKWYRKGAVKESGSYVGGKKVGRWETWHSNGQKESERHYDKDVEHGSFSLWKKSGQLREKGGHYQGKPHGTSKRWYKSNAQQEYEKHYNKGVEVGRWIEWRKNGKKKSETNYLGGQKHGEASTWFKNEQSESQGSYKEGMKHGKWLTWHRNGQKKMEAEYNLDERVAGTVSEWTSKGKARDPERVRVYLYGRDNCQWTRKALKRVKDSGIKYVYRRTDKSERNYEKYRKASQKIRCNSVPFALIDGKALCGYSPKEYNRYLK